MVCSYTQMEHDPAHTWQAAQGLLKGTLRERNPARLVTLLK